MHFVNKDVCLDNLNEALDVTEIVHREAKRLESGEMGLQNFSFMLYLLLRFILKEIENINPTNQGEVQHGK